MSRALALASALLVLSAGIASASDLVPGSDTGTRDAQASADRSVLIGSTVSEERAETSYGYPIGRTDRADSYVPANQLGERGARPATASDGSRTLVPASDSF
ncbi:hypothetical protein [Aureimonas sp. SK2]|uniref:hypothetical protein n=1 Tax=Aureimonas sp. SK2 TaxID=3015992 RepID=UPI0024439EC4|nr:hypothetical protein [Aureimonas sp. SK2]